MPSPEWSYPLLAAGATAVAGAVALYRNHKPKPKVTIWHHSINKGLCVGCSNCVDVCPQDVLKLVEHKSTVANFEACIQCRECESACPTQALRMYPDGQQPAELEFPVLSPYFETSVPGMYLVGEAAMVQFIKNAVNAGCIAVEHMVRLGGLRPGAGTPSAESEKSVDVLIVGAGPAGLSAALTCAELGLSFALVESSDTALATIMSYPEGKDVHAMPPDVQCLGPLSLPEGALTKAALREAWLPRARSVADSLYRQSRVTEISRLPDGGFAFAISGLGVSGRFVAQRVVLAIGGGSPRGPESLSPNGSLPGQEQIPIRLGLDNASRYKNQVALVLGGGNVAVEAAVHLSAPELNNHVILAYRDKRHKLKANGENRAALLQREADNRLRVACQTTVSGFGDRRAHLERQDRGKKETIPAGIVFVCCGKEPTRTWLEKLGVRYKREPHNPVGGTRVATDSLLRELRRNALPAWAPGALAGSTDTKLLQAPEPSSPNSKTRLWQPGTLRVSAPNLGAQPLSVLDPALMAVDSEPITAMHYAMPRLQKVYPAQPAESVAERRQR